MSGDDLTVRLFLFGLAVGFGIAAVSDGATIKRVFFGILGASSLIAGLFWLRIQATWPSFADQANIVATNPTNWFIVIMFALAVYALKPAKPKQMPWRMFNAGSPLPVAEQPSSTEESKSSPREFVDISPDALITLRRQPSLTAIQAQRILAPYIGKWLRVTGGVHDVGQNLLWLCVPAKPTNPSYNIAASPLDESNRQSFSLMEQSKEITIIGRIERIEYTCVYLDSCELVLV